MSLEKDIQDLTQAVALLVKAVDLNTATLSELSGTVMQTLTSSNVVNQPKGTPKDAPKETPAQTESTAKLLTEDDVKASPLYSKLIKALKDFSGKVKGNREVALELLKQYSEDGSAVGVVQQAMETESTEALDELLNKLTGEDPANKDDDSSTDGTTQEFTADDVKEALRKYAAIEGRAGAVLKLKELSGGKAQVKDIPVDMYAAVIEGLKTDF